MTESSISKLQFLCDTIPLQLNKIDEQTFSEKPGPEKWSKKEILGHLIDSATNNHHRFIRTQYENVPAIFYDQNKWNTLNHYQQIKSKHLVDFWTIYNQHLIEVIKQIPVENLSKECNSGEKKNVTLGWLIDDYVVHLEHHLKQITNY